MSRLTGLRTFTFAVVALVFLLAGLAMCLVYPTAGVQVFTAFAGTVFLITAAVAGKSAVGTLASGEGVKGAVQNLMTDKKPGQPPAGGAA